MWDRVPKNYTVYKKLISIDKLIRNIIGRSMFPNTLLTDNRSATDCIEVNGTIKLKRYNVK